MEPSAYVLVVALHHRKMNRKHKNSQGEGTYPLYAPSVEALKQNLARRYDEQDYIIEYIEV